MKRLIARISGPLVGIMAVFAASTAASAATFVVPGDGDLIKRSGAVVVGRVQSVEVTEGGGTITTTTVLQVEEPMKGPFTTGTQVPIVETGGAANGRALVIPGTPRYEVGDRVLVLLRQDDRGRWRTKDMVLGKFKFMKTRGGRAVLAREHREIIGWGKDGVLHRERVRDAGRFLGYVRSVTRGRAPREDYFTEENAEALMEEGTTSTASADATTGIQAAAASSYLMPAITIGGTSRQPRWPSFGSGVGFYNKNTQPNAPAGGINGVIAGMEAWNNDCGSTVQYRYLSSNPGIAGLDTSDDINGIAFEDPFNEVDGTFGVDSSTLGSGGFWVTSVTNSISGQTFWSITEGNVVLNNGLANWSGVADARFGQLMAHELGHSLGFRHADEGTPSTTDAIMRSSLVQNFGAALRPYDIDAVRSVYPGGSCTAVAAVKGDFTADGKADVIWRNGANGQNSFWAISGTSVVGGGTINPIADVNWKLGGAGDFNADGRSDLLWHNDATGANSVWFMNGTAYGSQAAIANGPSAAWKVGGVGDVNADGKVDLIWRNGSTGANAIWLMNGTSSSGASDIPAISDLTWQLAGAGDVNGDAKADLVWWNSGTGSVSVWLMNGTTRTSSWFVGQVNDTRWRVSAVGDFNGDGRADIMWRNSTNGGAAAWFLNGTSVLGGGFVGQVADTNWGMAGPR